jgi:hypothetical protein
MGTEAFGMAHINKVVRSINNEDASLCVDIFRRPDNTFGFEEYRREIEDGRGWFPIGGHSSLTFDNDSAALRAARENVVWLSRMLD